LAVASAAAGQYTNVDLGNALFRDYNKYLNLPITTNNASANGWTQVSSSCTQGLGYPWAQSSGGATVDMPMTLFFTDAGQLSGMGVNYYGEPPSNLVQQGFWEPLADGVYFMSIAFRDASTVCSYYYNQGLPLGDRLIVNANSSSPYPLPVTVDDAEAANWAPGSCFHTMGTHYFYDLATAPQMSWEAANLLPVVLMMNNGSINAVFFASSTIQQGLTSTHFWDLIPLPDILMCKNWCDSSCTWHDTNFWSTMHMFFNADYEAVTCPNGCTTACCSN
jgi:hypothetical protein